MEEFKWISVGDYEIVIVNAKGGELMRYYSRILVIMSA